MFWSKVLKNVSLREHGPPRYGLTLFIFWPISTRHGLSKENMKDRFLQFTEKIVFLSPEGLTLFIFRVPFKGIFRRWKTQTVSVWPYPLHVFQLFKSSCTRNQSIHIRAIIYIYKKKIWGPVKKKTQVRKYFEKCIP